MDRNSSKSTKTSQTSPESLFTTFLPLDGKSAIPSEFHTPATFTIPRLQSTEGLPGRITKIVDAHLLQQYGVVQKKVRSSSGGLAAWQKRRATELLHENIDGRIRLSEIARKCGLSVSHFARSFKISFGVSTHRWLIQHRIEHAKDLMSGTELSLMEIALHSGFGDQAAFTRTFHHLAGVSPGRWRRYNATNKSGD